MDPVPPADHPDVSRFQILVDEPTVMGVGQTLAGLGQGLQEFALAQAPSCDEGGQVVPFQVFHDQVGVSVIDSVIEKSNDVGVVHGRQGLGFPVEPGPAFPFKNVVPGDGLDGHFPAQYRIHPQIDLSHAPLAQETQNFKFPNLGTTGRMGYGSHFQLVPCAWNHCTLLAHLQRLDRIQVGGHGLTWVNSRSSQRTRNDAPLQHPFAQESIGTFSAPQGRRRADQNWE